MKTSVKPKPKTQKGLRLRVRGRGEKRDRGSGLRGERKTIKRETTKRGKNKGPSKTKVFKKGRDKGKPA